MKHSPCCHPRTGTGPVMRRAGGVAGVILSGIPLLLMPKCPVCVAAYVALFTGVTISASTAGHLRTAVILVCAMLAFLFIARGLVGLLGNRRR